MGDGAAYISGVLTGWAGSWRKTTKERKSVVGERISNRRPASSSLVGVPMSFVMTVPPGEFPKRGDLLQSNYGDRRERTWFILYAHALRFSKDFKPRFNVWRARWWELEPEFRMKLYRSAERHGGQTVWYPEAKKKFENLRLLNKDCA